MAGGLTVRELITRFGFDVDTGKIGFLDALVDKAKVALERGASAALLFGQRVGGAAPAVGALGGALHNATGALGSTAAGAGHAGNALARMGSQANTAQGTIASLVHHMGAMAAVWLSFHGLKRGAEFIVETAASFEQLRTSLITVTQDQRRANKAFQEVEDFAAKSPYSVRGLVDAYIQLAARGLNPGVKALEAYGNIASSMSKPMDQMVHAVTAATGGIFKPLKAFGIDAHAVGGKVEVTFQKVKTTIAKTSTAMEKYLQNIGMTKFAGGLERQSRTLKGAWSNLQDGAEALADKVGGKGEGGLLDGLTLLAIEMAEMVNGGHDLASAFGRGLNTALESTISMVKMLWGIVDGAAQAMGGWQAVGKEMALVFDLLIAKQIGVWASGVVVWINRITTATMAANFAAALAALGFILVGLAIGGIVLYLEDLYTYLNGGDAVLGDSWEAWVGYIDRIRGGNVGLLGFLRSIWGLWWDWMVQPILNWWNVIFTTLWSIPAVFMAVLDGIINQNSNAWSNIYNIVQNWIGKIKTLIMSIPPINFIANLVGIGGAGATMPGLPTGGANGQPGPWIKPTAAPGSAGSSSTTNGGTTIRVGQVIVPPAPPGSTGQQHGAAAVTGLQDEARRLLSLTPNRGGH